jgi:hypothetical protein
VLIFILTYEDILRLTKQHAMKTYWGSGGIAPRILISVLVEGDWSALLPAASLLWERALGTHWIGGWVGPRVDLDAVAKRKKSLFDHTWSRTLFLQPVA